MKKYFIVLSLSIFCVSCGSNSGSADSKEGEKSSVMDNPDYEKGLALVAKSGCFTCHKL
jgi:uncharacterized protein YcfL